MSTDYVPALLELGKARASAEGLAVRFEQADAENLQYQDASFDVVLSTFGVMFTPNRTYYGPMNKAFIAIGPDKEEALAKDLIELARRFNRAGDGAMVAPSEYLEVVITTR